MSIEDSAGKISITSQKPGNPSFQDFDVFWGKDPVGRDAQKAATFHNSTQAEGDALFNRSADGMETAGTMLFAEETKGETNVEKKEEAMGN